MGSIETYRGFLETVMVFLDLKVDDTKALIDLVKKTEPKERVTFDRKAQAFKLGIAVWPLDRIQTSLGEIQKAIRAAMERVVETGSIGVAELDGINAVCHDLKIKHFYAEDSGSHMRLGYEVPDKRISWEAAKCPHCGETVEIGIYPDPIPLFVYDALINTLRLLTRNVPLVREGVGRYRIAES